jgi:hypothetical protein
MFSPNRAKFLSETLLPSAKKSTTEVLAAPRREKLRIESELPSARKSTRLAPPIRESLWATEKPEPSFAALRRLIEEPRCAKESADTELPHRAKLRREIALPK